MGATCAKTLHPGKADVPPHLHLSEEKSVPAKTMSDHVVQIKGHRRISSLSSARKFNQTLTNKALSTLTDTFIEGDDIQGFF